MKLATALFTAATVVFSYLPEVGLTPTSATDDTFRLVDHGAYTDEDGREVEFAVWLDDGALEADVVVHDLVTDDDLELWLEGSELHFEGISNGERFSGSAPLSDFDAGSSTAICVGWVALVCVGALVILAAKGTGCAWGEGCVPPTPTNQPEGGGGVPETGGDGDGDGGPSGGGDSN